LELKKLQCSIFFLPTSTKSFDCLNPNEVQDTTSGTTGGTNSSTSNTVSFGDFTLTFALDTLGTSATFEVSAPTAGWVGIGFPSTAATMLKADLIIATVDNSTSTTSVNDYFAHDKAECDTSVPSGVCPDTVYGGTVDITQTSASETVGAGGVHTTKFKFTRKLVSSDSNDVSIGSGDVNLIFAYSADNTDTIKYHAGFKTNGKVNLQTGVATVVDVPYISIKRLHGAIMFIAWGFLISIGGLVARFFKSKGAWWFKVHIFCQMTGVILMVAAFVMAIMFTDVLNNPHFAASHQKAGLAVVILGLINPVLGSLADFLYKPDRKFTPIFPDLAHWFLGHLLIIGSFIVLFLGLVIIGDTNIGLFVALGIWVAGYVILFTIFQLKGLHKAPHGGEKLEN